MRVYVIRAHIDQDLFLKSYAFLNQERIIKHAFLRLGGCTGCIFWQMLIYTVRHNYGNTHFKIVLDKKESNLKISWIC